MPKGMNRTSSEKTKKTLLSRLTKVAELRTKIATLSAALEGLLGLLQRTEYALMNTAGVYVTDMLFVLMVWKAQDKSDEFKNPVPEIVSWLLPDMRPIVGCT